MSSQGTSLVKVTLVGDPTLADMQLVYYFTNFGLAIASFQLSYHKLGGVRFHSQGLVHTVYNCDIEVGQIESVPVHSVVLDQSTHF